MFDQTSTTDEVLEGVDLKGKRFLVTGVSAGLGVETARALVAHGADVVGTARDLEKAKHATGHVLEAAKASGGNFEIVEMDLASLASVRAAADALLRDGRTFDVVIANAGVMTTPQGKTADGFETQFGTNHLGHFLFVNRIAGLIKAGGRLVILSSAGHRFSDIDLDDPNFERTPYDAFAAYGYAKTANILFGAEFDRRHRDRGVRATALHPGGIKTELGRYRTPETTERLDAMVAGLAKQDEAEGREPYRYKSLEQGAATTVWAAVVAPAEAVGGRYCEDCHVAETVSTQSVGRTGVREYALDPERAKRLWAISEEMVGERF
ncbi:MAG: SDR family NAD(P)-dependent oxidoreductase [Sphingomonadaceae bacterium]|nr:SDR family NAD(P)-dependent oxidoreductase [Sphingomonadaceae bacterium]